MNMYAHKVCPFLFRHQNDRVEFLVFNHPHPRMGMQIVKGTVDPDEDIAKAACREMFEESGLQSDIKRYVGQIQQHEIKQTWDVFVVSTSDALLETWSHQTLDDGGYVFDFEWRDFNAPLHDIENWDPRYLKALTFMKENFNTNDVNG